jgi:hypothetical protein
MKPSAFIVLSISLITGCSRGPDASELFAKSAELVDEYLHTNAVSAENVMMLQLEGYTRACEKAGYRGSATGDVPLDKAFAAVYSRLYLVEKELGKKQEADQHYAQAAERWRKANAAEGKALTTAEEIRQQIESVDGYLGTPEWKQASDDT